MVLLMVTTTIASLAIAAAPLWATCRPTLPGMEKRDPYEIWIKPAEHGRLTKISRGFRWTAEERRLLWITAIGGAIGSLVTLQVVGLAVVIDRWKPSGGKAGEGLLFWHAAPP
jgi:hypothetical protein